MMIMTVEEQEDLMHFANIHLCKCSAVAKTSRQEDLRSDTYSVPQSGVVSSSKAFLYNTQEAVAPSRHAWKIVDPKPKQKLIFQAKSGLYNL